MTQTPNSPGAPGTPTGRTARRWLRRVPVALLVVIATFLAVTWLRMLVVNESGRTAYQAGDHTGAIRSFGSLNHQFEPWVAHFNLGTAQYMADEWYAAEASLATALPLAPAAHECDVRNNLAAAQEAIGDDLSAQRRYSDAAGYYEAALDTMDVPACQQDPADSQRREQKQENAENEVPNPPGSSPPASSPPPTTSSAPPSDSGSGEPSSGTSGSGSPSGSPTTSGPDSPPGSSDGAGTATPSPSPVPSDDASEHQGLLDRLRERNQQAGQQRDNWLSGGGSLDW